MRASGRPGAFASAADLAHCRALLRDGSRTFFAASLILPASVRVPATGLYAFCRVADDAIDRGVDRAAALARLRERLEHIYRGTPEDTPVDRLFADAVLGFSIPRDYPSALLEGFEWDVSNRRYQNLAELKGYAVRVAGTVGTMMAMLMNVRERGLLARACDLGVAMQLTNIVRDVGEDARNGRLYLPLDWLREAQIDPKAWLARPVPSAALGAVLERLLAAAAGLYAGSDAGISCLPPVCRPGMHAARLLYEEIGREVARRQYDSVNERAVVSWQRKARILADAMLASTRAAAQPAEEIMPEAQFLLNGGAYAAAESAAGPVESPRERARWPRIEDRVVWLIDLFERLERRERAGMRAVNS
jgi:phytoene synthase